MQLGCKEANLLFIVRANILAKDLAQLVVIGLNEKRVVIQHRQQRVTGGVYHNMHAFILQLGADLLINGAGHLAGHRPGQHQKVAGHQSLQLVEQSLHFRLCRLGAWGINIRLPIGKDLNIDSGVARCQRHKIRLDPLGLQHLLQCPAGKSGHEPQCPGGHLQSGQHHGHIDSLTAAQQLGAVRPVYILAA